MKRWLRWIGAAAAVVWMLGDWASAAQSVHVYDLPLADSLQLTEAFQTEKTLRSEQILTYESGGDVLPLVVYGSTLYGRSTMDTLEAYLSDRGYTAAGAVNAAFFDMSNGLPMGMVVTDGILRASGGGTTIGVHPDGSMMIGQPVLRVELEVGGRKTLVHYNQLLVEGNGLTLYSRDYDQSVKGGAVGYHVILAPQTAELTLDGRVTAKVTDIVEESKTCIIPETGFVLSLSKEQAADYHAELIEGLKPGDTVAVSVSIDEGWSGVQHAVGGGDLLVEHGKAMTVFSLDSAKRQAPRTAIGIRSDGSVICYTVDRSEKSAGMTLAELAGRMAELGCVTAVNMDGGGSACVGVTRPGEDWFTTVNEPSDGGQRACANFLFFVRPTTAPPTRCG